ncbi:MULTISPECIES: gamma-glutamylcyclotransferase family protein [Aphanothece]|uniref:gamma-glutamylcyclotransferase family protein n=1 Tax=Aphanothece TaxID=1121 RepID=UPI00398EBE2A
MSGTAVFVYGTLKRGMRAHHRLGGAAFQGEASLSGAWLHDLGPFPMAVPAPPEEPEAQVHGELFRVEPATLAQLDRFEGVPRLYQRHWLELSNHQRAWVYLGQAHQVRFSPRLADGRWRGAAAQR